MQIVFSHYHLNASGVTHVILNQVRSLAALPMSQRPERLGLLYGGRGDGWPEPLWNDLDADKIETVMMPLAALDYSQLPTLDDAELAQQTADLLRERGFEPGNTILHLHNHSLGKNVSWPGAIAHLAKLGYRVLLQVHDFVEDFRPTNYRHLATTWHTDDPTAVAGKQFPTGTGIHYATLTSRDQKLLELAGIESSQLHLLPNPVAEFHGLPDRESVAHKVRQSLGTAGDSRLVLYPVRGIRRKNVGELLLQAAVSQPNTYHAITLAPTNPVELPSFERWQTLSQSLGLRCLFDVCGNGTVDFMETLAASDAVITTSVAEGFGMVYLESWLAGKPLIGRDLPEITCDFKDSGIVLDHLYTELPIPIEMLGNRSKLVESFELAYHWACESYSVPPVEDNVFQEQIEQLFAGDTVDFALLPSRYQEQVIRQAADQPVSLRPIIESATNECDSATIESNAKIARQQYSLAENSSLLEATYKSLATQPTGEVTPAPAGEKILEQFLSVDRLHAIRFEE